MSQIKNSFLLLFCVFLTSCNSVKKKVEPKKLNKVKKLTKHGQEGNKQPSLDNSKQSDIKQPLSKKQPSKERKLTICNCISKKMLDYKYCFVSYHPNSFSIQVNGQKIEEGKKLNLTLKDTNTLTVRYDYEFMNGYRKGAKQVIFDIEPDAKKLDITFSWKDKHRILINHAKPMEEQRIKV